MGAEVQHAWNNIGGCCSSVMDKERKRNQTLRIEPLKCLEFLSKQPSLGKYGYKMNDNQDNL